jgi:eukaryotic-like serine/threonine-protein kinase
MDTTERLQGRHGGYELLDPKPVMFGRLSAFFSARDERTGGEVLVKRFTDLTHDDSPVKSFYREVDTIFGLRHPNILQIIDYEEGDDKTAPFLVLPWCRGGNLRQLSRQQDFLPLETAMHLLRQTASAIDYAHQQGVIHGDIKPENILLSDDKRTARLADFGMAKHFEVTDRVVSKELVVDGGGGTSAYLSPEQLSNNVQTPRSDIYSFGLVAYELLAGRLPFDLQAPLYRQLQARVAGDLVDPQVANPAISITVRDALNCALASDAAARPASAQEFCDMLMGLRRPISKPVPKSGRRRPNAIWQDLEPAGKAAVVGAAIAAGGGILVALVQLLPKLVGGKP